MQCQVIPWGITRCSGPQVQIRICLPNGPALSMGLPGSLFGDEGPRCLLPIPGLYLVLYLWGPGQAGEGDGRAGEKILFFCGFCRGEVVD